MLSSDEPEDSPTRDYSLDLYGWEDDRFWYGCQLYLRSVHLELLTGIFDTQFSIGSWRSCMYHRYDLMSK